MSSSFSYTFSQTNSQTLSNTFQSSGAQHLTHAQSMHLLATIYAILGVIIVVSIILYFFYSYCLGLIFRKAGQKMWPAFVPIYNLWVMFEMADLPGWLSLLAIVPFFNLIAAILQYVALFRISKNFSKRVAFYIVGLVIFPYVGVPILAFGKSTYSDPKTTSNNNASNNPMNNSQGGGGFMPQNPINQGTNDQNQSSNNSYGSTGPNQTLVSNPEPIQAQTVSNQNFQDINQTPPSNLDSGNNINSNLGVSPQVSPNSSAQEVVQPPVDNQVYNDPNNPTTPTNP